MATQFLHSSVLTAAAAAAPVRCLVLFGGRKTAHPAIVLPFTGISLKSVRPVKATTGTTGGAPYEEGGEEDCELVRKFKAAVQAGLLLPAEPESVELPELHERVIFESIAMSSYELWITVCNKFKPSTDSKLYEGLYLCGQVFTAGVIRRKAISWKRACDIAEGLDLLRRLVSSALQLPLPLKWTWHAMVPMEYNSEKGLSLILQGIHSKVHKDIKSMLSNNDTE